MASWIDRQDGTVQWPDFLGWYRGFAPSGKLIELVRSLWDSGELFLGTYLARQDGGYTASGELLLPARHTLVAKRRRVA